MCVRWQVALLYNARRFDDFVLSSSLLFRKAVLYKSDDEWKKLEKFPSTSADADWPRLAEDTLPCWNECTTCRRWCRRNSTGTKKERQVNRIRHTQGLHHSGKYRNRGSWLIEKEAHPARSVDVTSGTNRQTMYMCCLSSLPDPLFCMTRGRNRCL